MFNQSEQTVSFTHNGAAHTAEVVIVDQSWERGSVSFADYSIHVKSIDGRRCLDIFLADAETYKQLCVAAKKAVI